MLPQTIQKQEDIEKLLSQQLKEEKRYIENSILTKSSLTNDDIKRIIEYMLNIANKGMKTTNQNYKDTYGNELENKLDKLLERKELKDEKYNEIKESLNSLKNNTEFQTWENTLNDVKNKLKKLNQEKTQRPRDMSWRITESSIQQSRLGTNTFSVQSYPYSTLKFEFFTPYYAVDSNITKLLQTRSTFSINQPGEVGKPMFSYLPGLITPGFQQNPPRFKADMQVINTWEYTKNGNYEKIDEGSNLLFRFTGVGISKGVVLNEATLQSDSRYKNVLLSPLDLLFKEDKEYNGRILSFFQNKKSGEIVGYYNDSNNNWFLTDIRIKDGKVISGSQGKGRLDFDSFKASFDLTKTNNKNVNGYMLVNIPGTGSTLFGQETYAKKQVGLAQDVGSIGLQGGYLELKPGFLGNEKKQKGGFIGLYGNNVSLNVHGAGSIGGLEGYNQGDSHKIYLAGSYNRENLEKNFTIATTKDFDETKVSFALNQNLSRGENKGAGLISIKTPDWNARVAYDNITQSYYYDYDNVGLIKNIQNRNTFSGYLVSVGDYSNLIPFKSAKQPKAGVELDLKKENQKNLTFKIFKNHDRSYTFGVERKDGIITKELTNFEFSTGPKSMITLSGNNFNFQLGEHGIVLIKESKNITTSFDKVFGENTEKFSVSYTPDNNVSVGGIAGSEKGKMFIGVIYTNKNFEFMNRYGKFFGSIEYFPYWNRAVAWGVGFSTNVLGDGYIHFKGGQIIMEGSPPSTNLRVTVDIPLDSKKSE
jgi:hypothetical protein